MLCNNGCQDYFRAAVFSWNRLEESELFWCWQPSFVTKFSRLFQEVSSQQQIPASVDKCFKQFQITDPAIQQKIMTDHSYRFKDEMCFTKCILESDKLVTTDGKIVPQNAKAFASQHKKALSDQQIAKCNAEGLKAGGKDTCIVASASFSCLAQAFA